MPSRIAAKGYTRVLLVLNMKHFIPDETERKRFETLRGSELFAEALQDLWPESLQHQSRFSPLTNGDMATEDIGFATGVFRSLMLERLSAPAYLLNKDQAQFPSELEDNFQFKTLFKRAWARWTICIRPTMTGFFVIRLTYNYEQSPRTLIDLAKDAIKLQEPMDVLSAVRWLEYNRERYKDNPTMLVQKEDSVKALLAWLGADVDNPQTSETLYYPVQWKLALVAINMFVENGRFTIPYQDGDIHLQPAPPNLSLPLHDSYIIYHFNDLLAEPEVIDRSHRGKTRDNAKRSVSLNDFRKSNQLRNALVSLLEGTVLREPNKPDDELDSNGYFPSPRWSLADEFFTDPKANLASWSDELCLFTSRAALIMPSKKWANHEMAISTVPSATLKIQYIDYWEAIERMMEFVLEVHILAQLIERDSYKLLAQIANTIERIRADMFDGDIIIEGELKAQMAQAAHLRRIAAFVQSASHSPFWARAEYAVMKAEKLFDLLDVPRIITHIDRNIESINSVADHVDELYIADLSEKSNDKATLLSIGVAALSFIVILLVMPSFWFDLRELHEQYWPSDAIYTVILYIGTFLGAIVFVLAFLLMFMAMRRQNFKKHVSHLFNRD